jgi:hypothetical protein
MGGVFPQQASQSPEEAAAVVCMGVACIVRSHHWFGIGGAPFNSA